MKEVPISKYLDKNTIQWTVFLYIESFTIFLIIQEIV